MDKFSITSLNNLKKRTKLNLYLNDCNTYYQNTIKMRKKHLSTFNDKIKVKNEFKKHHPIPKTLYSTSEFNFKARKKLLVEQFNIKNSIHDLMDVVNNFTETLNFNEDLDSKTDKTEDDISLTLTENRNKNIKTLNKKQKNKKYKDFFITNKYDKNKETKSKTIEKNKPNFKNNLFFENYGKFKFTKEGIIYPNRLKKYELPKYEGENKELKQYYNYRKKISFPEQEYNKISQFDEKFNKDLGTINNNYNKYNSRTRFTENPLLKKYMEVIPIYDIYRDLKEIENRYIGTKYKFKLLPLYNKRITNLDKLADKFYKTQYSKEGLIKLLKIQSNKNKE